MKCISEAPNRLAVDVARPESFGSWWSTQELEVHVGKKVMKRRQLKLFSSLATLPRKASLTPSHAANIRLELACSTTRGPQRHKLDKLAGICIRTYDSYR